ncbi:AMP-binding protein [Streptomyces sp. NPDC053069]|uniref:AMP-binding protein n=1 Tax=Streptomyces sp. NPDC053069 TaxID=3365695 RepID=UPI0037D3383C
MSNETGNPHAPAGEDKPARLHELSPFQQAALGRADRELLLHVRVPGAGTTGLRDALYRALSANPALTGDHEWVDGATQPLQRGQKVHRQALPDGSGWELTGGTLRITVTGGWDGPEVRIACGAGFADTRSIGMLLADAASTLEGAPAAALARPDYLAVATAHRAMIRKGELAEEERYWALRQPDGPGRATVCDVVPGSADDAPADGAGARHLLDRRTGELMAKAAAEAGCSGTDLAGFALAVVLRRLALGHAFAVAADARELMGLDTVCGPLTQVFPLVEDIDLGQGGAEALSRWLVRLDEARAMLGVPALPHGTAQPELVFDTTGEPALPSGWYRVAWRHPLGARFTCSLREDDGSGGALHIDATGPAPRSRLDALLNAWGGLLADLVARPQTPVAQLALLPAGAREELTERMAASARHTTAEPLGERFMRHVRDTPDALACRQGSQRATYRQLEHRVSAVAAALGEVRPGTVVGVLAEAEPDLPAALLAVHRLGAVFLPLSPHEPPARLADAVRLAGATVVLTGRGTPDITWPDGCRAVALADIPQTAQAVAPAAAVRPQDPAYLLRTSGSTGVPKLVEISRASLDNYLRWCAEELLSRQSVLPVLSSPVFDASLKQTLGVLYGGGCITLLTADRLDLEAVRAELAALQRPISLNCVPSYASALLTAFEAAQPQPLPSVRRFLLGGEPLDPSLVRRIGALFPEAEIWNLYGPTETTATATAGRVTEGRTISVGTAVAGAGLAVVDSQGLPLPHGIRGEVAIGGPGVGGYRAALPGESPFGRLDLGERSFPVYRTGDLGVLDEGGALRVAGRQDHQVKLNGWRIDLGEVEQVALAADGVREAAVVLDDRGDPCLRAFVTGNTSSHLVLAAFQRHLPRPMIPASVTVLPALDTLVNGKVDRKALLGRAERSEEAVPEEYDTYERIVATAWREIVGQGWPRPDDEFFNAGGHSLLLARLVNRLRAGGHETLSLQQVVVSPTVASIAALIRTAHAG